MTGFASRLDDTCDEANPELQVSKIGLSCPLKISRLVSARKTFPYPFNKYFSNQPSLPVRDGWTLTSLSFAVLSTLPVHNIYRERTWSISSHLVCTSLVREADLSCIPGSCPIFSASSRGSFFDCEHLSM